MVDDGGSWQWSSYIEIMMYLSSTIMLIIAHLQGAALGHNKFTTIHYTL